MEPVQLGEGKTYQHYKNKKLYTIIEFIQIQEEDEWVDAVLYCPEESPENKFVRSYREFGEKFQLVPPDDELRPLEILWADDNRTLQAM